MRTLNFPQKSIELLSDENIDRMTTYLKEDKNRTAKNGLVKSVISAYNAHYILTLSPDDLMNNICHVWAKYIILNAENFRSQIVLHQGKKNITIIVENNTIWNEENIHLHMKMFIDRVSSENTSIQWMNVEFTTTKELDRMVRMVATLASQKEYYQYTSRTMCWLPRINLLGSVEDWELLHSKIQEMPTFDSNMVYWKEKLLYVVSKFIVGSDDDIEFWQSPLTYYPGGSGSIPYYSGWITVFNPFSEKGNWGKQSKPSGFSSYKDSSSSPNLYYWVPQEDILDLTSDFSIICEDDMGVQHGTLNIFAGPTAINASVENGLSPKNKLYFNFVKSK